jgi:hypothetical protein
MSKKKHYMQNIDTLAYAIALANQIETKGGFITDGFGRKELRFEKNGRIRYSNGSAVGRDGNEFQVQNVDTIKNGEPTKREREAALDITEISGQSVICIAKIV